MEFRKKPNPVEAVHWTGDNYDEMQEFGPVDIVAEHELGSESFNMTLLAGVNGAQGWVPVPIGHWIVRNPGDDTDYWPVDNAFMEKNYEPAPLGTSLPETAEPWFKQAWDWANDLGGEDGFDMKEVLVAHFPALVEGV